MSKLTDLLRQVERNSPQLAADLEREYKALSSRRSFGLNFERHVPETTEIPGRKVRKDDKVHILSQRGSIDPGDKTLWRVERITRTEGEQIAHLIEHDVDEPERRTVSVDDLVVVAVFREFIYPGLIETDRVERDDSKPTHTVINGENYHTLQALTYTHRGKVDAIYIDPPYNTGAKDWKYNNDYVGEEDIYRHSKWLSFMEKRLELARDLLNPNDSILIVTIDEKENARLVLLLEQVFNGAKIQTVSSLINPQGVSSGVGEFSRTHEYVHFVYIGSAGISPWSRSMVENDKEANDVSADLSVRWADFARYGGNASRQNSPGAFFPIYVDIESETIHSIGRAIDWEEDVANFPAPEGTRAVWPPQRPDGQDGRWRTVAETARVLASKDYIRVGRYNKKNGRYSFSYLQGGIVEKIDSGEVDVIGRDDKGAVIVQYSSATKTATPKTIWTLSSHDASRHGANLLRKMIGGRNFPYPKSLFAVEDALRFAVQRKPQAVVLDFFAGSGTTAHAVMRLNRQDGGQRQCISVTNNEVAVSEVRTLRKSGFRPNDPEWEALGICDYITKPRIKAAITGRTPTGDPISGEYKVSDVFPISEGFFENARFFTLTYENRLAISHHKAFRQIAPLLWLRAGARGECIESEPDSGWALAEVYGVLVDLDASTAFIEAVAATDGIGMAFVVTDDERRFQAVVRRLPDGVEAVRLYESYLRNFQFKNGG